MVNQINTYTSIHLQDNDTISSLVFENKTKSICIGEFGEHTIFFKNSNQIDKMIKELEKLKNGIN